MRLWVATWSSSVTVWHLGANTFHCDARLVVVTSGRPDYSGMSVNERLFGALLLDDWDSAIIARDRQRAIEILGDVDMDETSAAQTVDTTLSNPSEYGFAPR